MSEYINVEYPFLEKFREIGWKVIDQGNKEQGNYYGAESQSWICGEI